MTKENIINDKNQLVDKKLVQKTWFRYWLSAEMSNSYERLQSLSFCYSMIPVLKKLYPEENDLKEALQRHLNFFNTEPTWGAPILGISIAMEEEKSLTKEIPGEAITALKTGLMGPLAGIGDTIDWGTLKTIIYGIAVTFASNGIAVTFASTGNILGAFIPVLFTVLTFIIGSCLTRFGYTTGKNSVKSILQQGWIKELIFGTSILGLFMMGALTSNFVKITTPLTFAIADGQSIAVQDILNSIAPGILPLCVVFGIYYFLTKGKVNYGLLAIGIVIVCLLCSLLGIL